MLILLDGATTSRHVPLPVEGQYELRLCLVDYRTGGLGWPDEKVCDRAILVERPLDHHRLGCPIEGCDSTIHVELLLTDNLLAEHLALLAGEFRDFLPKPAEFLH